MDRIICDICGTTYHASAQQCPICGAKPPNPGKSVPVQWAQESSVESHRKGGRFAMTKEQKKYQETTAPVYRKEQPPVQTWEQPQPRRGNPLLIALLVTVTFVLLVGTAVLYLRYYLPNQNLPDPDAQAPVIQEQTEPTETTEPTIPCTHLALLSGGSVELTQPGYKYLIHVATVPENTTDKVVFTSQDESIATVSKEGRVTAISEGSTRILVTCGNQSFFFQVICDFSPEE